MALNFGNITLVEDEPEIIKKPIDFGTIKLVEEPVEQPKLDFGAIKPIEEIGLPKPTFEAPTFEEEAKVTAAPNTTAIQAPVEKPNIVPKVLWVSQRGAEKVESHMGLAYGLDQIGMNLGSIIEYGGNKLDVEKMADLGQKIYKHYSERPAVKAGVPEEIKGQVWEKPELMLDPKWWSFNISQIAPSLAIAMVPALAAKNIITVGGTALKLTPKVVGKLATLGASLTGGITGGTLEGASTYQEMKTDPEVTEQEAQVAAEMMACGSAALNALSVGRLLTKLPKGVLSSGLHRAVTGAVEAITEWLEEPIEVIAKRMAKKEIGDIPETVKEAVQAIKEGANVVGPSFLLGALTGGIQIPKEAKVAELESVTEAKQDEGVLEETEEKPEGAEIKLTTEEETGLKEAIKIDYQRGGLSEEEVKKPPQAKVPVGEGKMAPKEGKAKRRLSYEEFEALTERAEKQRLYEMNPVTGRPGTPHFERVFRKATKNETKNTTAGAGDIDGYKVVNDTKGPQAADDLNGEIYDAGEKVLGKDRLSNLHGDEYAVIAKEGQLPAQTAKEVQKVANEIAKLEIEIEGQIFHPTMKWRIGSPKSLKEFGEINPKSQPPNTIMFDKEGKGQYITIKAADVPPERILTRDKFEKGATYEDRLRESARTVGEAKQPPAERLGLKSKVPGRKKVGVSEGKSGLDKIPPTEVPPEVAPKQKVKAKISGGLGAGLGEKVDFPDIYSFVKMTEKEALKNPPKGFTFGKLPDKEDIAQAMPDGTIKIDPDNFYAHSQENRIDILEHEMAHFAEEIIDPKDKASYFDVPEIMNYRGRNINEKLANMIQDGKLPEIVLKKYPQLYKEGGGLGAGLGAQLGKILKSEEELAAQTGFAVLPGRDIINAKIKVPETAKKKYEEMVSEIQVREFDSDKAINEVQQQLNKKEREVATFVREKTDIPEELNRPDLEKIIKDPKLKTKISKVADEVGKHFHEGWKYMQENLPDMSAEEVENYVTHVWDIPKAKISEAVNWFATRNPFLKKRFFKTYEAGIKKGYKPKTLDITDLMRIHDRYMIRTTEHVKFIEALKKMQDEAGIKLIQRADKAPADWISIDHPVLRRAIYLPGKKGKPAMLAKINVKYHPDLDPMMQAVFGKRWKGRGLGAELLKGYEYFNALLKKSQLSISLFHHMALSETAVATIGPMKTLQISPLNAAALYRALVKGKYDIYGSKYEVAREGIKLGLQIGAITDIQRNKIQQLLQNLENDVGKISKTLALPVKGLRKANELWDKALWDYLHNNLKAYGYEAISQRMIKSLKNPTTEQIVDAKKEAAQFINDTFGGQNWERMMTNPKTLQMAQWALLSPDWTLSTIKQALAPTGVGAIANRGLRIKAGVRFWATAGFYFGVGINMLNFALTKADDAEEREKPFKEGRGKFLWENNPGHKTHLFAGRYDDGSKRYVRWGKQFRELFELFYDVHAGEFSPLTATLKRLGSKTSPMLQQASVIFTGKTPSGFKVSKLNEETGWKWIGALTTHIIKSPLPFAFANTLNETKEFKVTDLAFPSSKGMTYYKTKKMFKKAIVKKRQNFVREIFKAATENNLDSYSILKDALRELKREASSELDREVRQQLGKEQSLEKFMANPEEYIDKQDVSPAKKKAFVNVLIKASKKKAMIENWEHTIKICDELLRTYEIEKETLEKVVEK